MAFGAPFGRVFSPPFPTAGAAAVPITFVNSATANVAFGTTVICNVPAGVVDGDVMLALVQQGGVFILTAPAGWTLLAGPTGTRQSYLYWRLASGEPVSYTWTLSANGYLRILTVAYRGVTSIDALSVFALGGSAAGYHDSTAVVASVTPTANGVEICLGSIGAGNGAPKLWTGPGGTERVNQGAFYQSCYASDFPAVNGVATGTRSFLYQQCEGFSVAHGIHVILK